MTENKPYLPRDLGSRVAIGCVSLFFGYLWGGAVFVFAVRMPVKQFGMLGNLIFAAVEEMLVAATLVMSLLFIWAIATPPWVEHLFRWAWKKLHWTILLALVAGLCFVLYATIWNNAIR